MDVLIFNLPLNLPLNLLLNLLLNLPLPRLPFQGRSSFPFFGVGLLYENLMMLSYLLQSP